MNDAQKTHSLENLSPEDRLYHHVGSIAVQWQRLLEHTEMMLRSRRVKLADSLTFSQLIELWYTQAKDANVIKPSRLNQIYKSAKSYHLLRDALVHGNPRYTAYQFLEGRDVSVIEFRLRTKKPQYKSEWKRAFSALMGPSNRRNMRKYLSDIDKEEKHFTFCYALEDIASVSYCGLSDLSMHMAAVDRSIERKLRGAPDRSASPISTYLASVKLPPTIEQLSNVQLRGLPLASASTKA